MTREEAVTKLTNIMHDDHYAWHPSILEAFSMAVDALRGAEGDCVSRQAAIENSFEVYTKEYGWCEVVGIDAISELPSAQPETYKEKLNEIASALSEKFAYMNTCLNERDIILGYLGVKRSCETHCNTDCTNTKCESHPLFAQPEQLEQCQIYGGVCGYPSDKCYECQRHSGVQPQRWIPVTEKLPEDLEEVNVTWINHIPEPYYDFLKDKSFTGSAVYYRGDWYWYSSRCTDILAEYGTNGMDKVDDGIEITAWMSLPEPWKEGEADD